MDTKARCHRCWHLEQYCACADERERDPELTDYEVQRRRTNINAAGYGAPLPADHVPTPTEFVINALGGDPSQDILILCEDCGVTLSPECSYGGWHDQSQWLEVRFHASDPVESK